MIEVKSYIAACILDCGLNELNKICRLSILAGTRTYLKNQWRILLLACFNDTLDDLHVVYIKCTDCIIAVKCLAEHFFSCY